MSVVISVTITDSLNGTTTDTCSFSDADGSSFLATLATANAPQPSQQQIRQAQLQGLQPPVVVPLTYDACYHGIVQNWFSMLQNRVNGIKEQAANNAALAAVVVVPLAPTSQSTTTPVAQGSSGVVLPSSL